MRKCKGKNAKRKFFSLDSKGISIIYLTQWFKNFEIIYLVNLS